MLRMVISSDGSVPIAARSVLTGLAPPRHQEEYAHQGARNGIEGGNHDPPALAPPADVALMLLAADAVGDVGRVNGSAIDVLGAAPPAEKAARYAEHQHGHCQKRIDNQLGSPAPRQGEYKDYCADFCQRIILLPQCKICCSPSDRARMPAERRSLDLALRQRRLQVVDFALERGGFLLHLAIVGALLLQRRLALTQIVDLGAAQTRFTRRELALA